ncbi:MAG: hypothetical protein LBU05_02855 [Bifidobacteriaceae bacterium]|nr:hypothetical protein [Bifidobacteriaceae bacterium]
MMPPTQFRPRLLIGLFALLAALGVVAPASPAFAGTADDVQATYEKALSVLENKFGAIDFDTATPAEVTSQTGACAEEVNGYAADLQELADSASNDELSSRIAALAEGLNALATALNSYGPANETAVATGDIAALTAAEDQYFAVIDQLTVAEQAYNTYLEEHPATAGDTMWFVWTGLFALSILGAVLALAIWAKNRKSPLLGHGLAASQRNLLLAAGLFLIGAGIPTAQYWRAKAGSEYTIFWYPLVVGGIWFLIAVPQYFAAAKKAKQAVAASASEPYPMSAPGAQPPLDHQPGRD